jgi:hypothetical protein
MLSNQEAKFVPQSRLAVGRTVAIRWAGRFSFAQGWNRGWLNAALLIACWDIAILGRRGAGVPYWLTIAALTCSNGCWHAWASFKSREYSPGVVTGIAIYIPVAIYGYNQFLKSGAASTTTALIAAIIGGSYPFWSALFHRKPQRQSW